MSRNKKCILCLLLSIILVLGLPLYCFAETDASSEPPDNALLRNVFVNEALEDVTSVFPSWSGWIKSDSYNTNKTLESYTDAMLFAALSGGIVWSSVGAIIKSSCVATIGWIMTEKPKNVYYTTILYVRFDTTGAEQRKVIRRVYSDKKRTIKKGDDLVTSITTVYHSTMSLDEVM